MALIDEFQDTDPVQWRIFERLFGEEAGDSSLVLVGDPKQAIYGFRGGDIETYIRAVGDNACIERRSMRSNWRSDAAMLTALDVLFDGVTFGDQSIGFVPVTAARDSQDRHICDADGPMPALSVRLAVGAGIDRTKQRERGRRSMPRPPPSKRTWWPGSATSSTTPACRRGHEDAESRKVRPDDIAVLVTTNDQCSAVQAALTSQGVPAVVANAGNVLGSPAADQMRWLLHAMARPSDPRRARTYALSWFGGWSAEEVAAASDADLSDIQEHLARLVGAVGHPSGGRRAGPGLVGQWGRGHCAVVPGWRSEHDRPRPPGRAPPPLHPDRALQRGRAAGHPGQQPDRVPTSTPRSTET